MYKTPVFGGGWDITALYQLDDATEDSTRLSANVNWKTGNWYASLAYETRDKGLNDGTLADGTVISTDPKSSSATRLGVYWTPGAWKLTAFYHAAGDANGIESLDQIAYGLGAAYKMGKNVLKAQYYTTANDAPGASSIDASTIALAWDYNFSKRTTAYIAYAATSNDENIYEGVDQSGHGSEIYNQVDAVGTPAEGKDPSAISLGVIHKF
jgi:predicted porin